MAKYVDGFVLAVPKRKAAAYLKMARAAGKIWIEHGALEFRECSGDDMKTGHGTPFPKVVKTKPGEVVFFSWVVYKSRAHRDRVNSRVMNDPRMAKMPNPAPFDIKRMSWGGFKVVVDLG